MKTNVTEAMVEQFARYNEAGLKARGGTSMPFAYHLSGARTHFALGGTMPPAAAGFARNAPESPKTPPRPLSALLAPVSLPPRAAVPAAVVADRDRAVRLLAMTARGNAEAEAECGEAIRAGTAPEEYRATVAARSILDFMRR